MTYSVTGIRVPPDVGFQAGHRHTAEGARELATAFAADGLREIEVRDHHGNLTPFGEFEDDAAVSEGMSRSTPN